MPWPDIRDEDQLTWRFIVVDDEPDFYDKPTGDVDPPQAWWMRSSRSHAIFGASGTAAT